MRVHWERTGILVPVFRLAGQGFNDDEIANKLNIPGSDVQGCVAWLLHFLEFSGRMELMQCASVQRNQNIAPQSREFRKTGRWASKLGENAVSKDNF